MEDHEEKKVVLLIEDNVFGRIPCLSSGLKFVLPKQEHRKFDPWLEN